MFSQVPNVEKSSLPKIRKKRKNRKSKKRSAGSNKKNKGNHTKFSSAMSSWAENFTVAATWQLKHQLAYWKAKALSLEYENRLLHDIIRRNNLVVPSTTRRNSECEVDLGHRSTDDLSSAQTTDEEETSEDAESEEAGENFEVSEEFIQFLTTNAKYKEDARRERDRLKAKLMEEEQEMLQPNESYEQTKEHKRELYGDKWQSIASVELSIMSDFINTSDKYRPMYWPNIPFNFNSS